MEHNAIQVKADIISRKIIKNAGVRRLHTPPSSPRGRGNISAARRREFESKSASSFIQPRRVVLIVSPYQPRVAPAAITTLFSQAQLCFLPPSA